MEVLQIYEANKAMIDSQVATANAYPRDEKTAMDKAIKTVTMDIEIAKSCIYSVPRGGKKLTGKSVRLAEIAVQFWKNFRAESRVVEEAEKHVTAEAVAYDLEYNSAYKSQVQRSIVGNNGRFNQDMIGVTGNAAMSIAYRNAVLKVLPQYYTDAIYEAAQNKITGDVSDETKLKVKCRAMVDGLMQRYQITEKQVLSAVSRETIDHMDKEDIIVLTGIDTAIKEGGTTVDYAFKGKVDAPVRTEAQTDQREQRLIDFINKCATEQQLKVFQPKIKTNAERIAYDNRLNEIKNGKGK